jgi:hypothetical protein
MFHYFDVNNARGKHTHKTMEYTTSFGLLLLQAHFFVALFAERSQLWQDKQVDKAILDAQEDLGILRKFLTLFRKIFLCFSDKGFFCAF